MAKTKYSIIDADDQTIGFVIIEQPRFEHTAPTNPINIDGPIADAILLASSLAGFTAIPYLFGGGWLSAIVGVSVTATLAGIKARYGYILPDPNAPEPTTVGVHITGEFVNDTTMHLDEIKRPDLPMTALTNMCQVIASNAYHWVGRPTAKRHGVTRTQHGIIREEFERLGYIGEGKAGSEAMTGRGRLFVRKVQGLSQQ